jgi:hypothetical protein
MRRAALAVLLIAALWTGALVAYVFIDVRNYAPNTGYIVLLGGLWLTALVVYYAFLNPEGRLSRYIIVAAISLAVAAVLVGGLKLLLTPMSMGGPPG